MYAYMIFFLYNSLHVFHTIYCIFNDQQDIEYFLFFYPWHPHLATLNA